MAYAIVYNSKGGNTKMVAEALQQALTGAGVEATLTEVTPDTVQAAAQAARDAEAVLAGFWCDKGSCTPEMADFLSGLAGARVFLFGTAGFGGEPAYFARILESVRAKLPEAADYLGGAMCQGKMGPAVRQRYEAMLAEKPDDPRIQSMIANFDAASTHPNAVDLEEITTSAKKALNLQ